MDAVIKLSSAEFNQDLFDKIGNLLKGKDVDVTISLRDKSNNTSFDKSYWLTLNNSIEDIKQGNGTTFTMQELETFINQ